MKRIPVEYAVLALAAAASLAVTTSARAQTPGAGADVVARGKYLVTVAVCNDCHTPWKMGDKGPEPDMSRMLSGHPEGTALPPPPAQQGPWIMSASATNTAWAGPWGISYTANLTPDAETGLGKWTLRNFVETIRSGRHMGRGRELLPPMPAPMYRHFSDEDLAAIFSYLQSVPAVKNRVPQPQPPAAAVAVAEKGAVVGGSR